MDGMAPPVRPVEPMRFAMSSDDYRTMVERIATTLARTEGEEHLVTPHQRDADLATVEWWLAVQHAAGYVPTPRVPA